LRSAKWLCDEDERKRDERSKRLKIVTVFVGFVFLFAGWQFFSVFSTICGLSSSVVVGVVVVIIPTNVM